MFQQTKQTPIKYGINPIALKFKWHNLENPDSLSSSDFVFLTLLMYTRTAIKWAAISAVQLQHSHPMLLRGGKPHKTFNLDFMLHANLNISQTHPGTCSNASKELKDLNTKSERQTVHRNVLLACRCAAFLSAWKTHLWGEQSGWTSRCRAALPSPCGTQWSKGQHKTNHTKLQHRKERHWTCG